MVNSRAKWCDYERKIAIEMRELWFTDCLTSRAESKSLDDCWVDLVETGDYNFQLKCYTNFSVRKCIEVLKTMTERLVGRRQAKNTNIILVKIKSKGEVVVMSKKDFYKLITK